MATMVRAGSPVAALRAASRSLDRRVAATPACRDRTVDLMRAVSILLSCPSCTGPLQPWGHARTRTVRDHGTSVVVLRPRRGRCRSCRGTHVLLPAVVAPRRADTTAVIGSALQASARGTGYRQIATQLARPLSTVRRWIRAVRDPAHLEWLRTQGMVWLSRIDLDVINTLAPQATRLGDALNALAAAVLTIRARVVPHVPPWTLIGQITHGRLVGPPVPARPG